MTAQILSQYLPHLVFLPTGIVISGSRVFSISLTGIQFLFRWNNMGFSSMRNILEGFVCMFIFSIYVEV